MNDSPGSILSAAREARGWTEQIVCDQIKLNINHIRNLEADRFDKLPPATFVMGYIRSYAKLLEIDPEPIIAGFRQKTAIEPPPVAQPAEVNPPEPEERELSEPSESYEQPDSAPLATNLPLIAASAFAVVLLMVLGWWMLGTQPDALPLTESRSDSVATDSSGFLPDEVLFKDSVAAEPVREDSVGDSLLENNVTSLSVDSVQEESQEMINSASPLIGIPETGDSTETIVLPPPRSPQTPVRQPQEQIVAVVEEPPTPTPAPPLEDVLLLRAGEDSWVSISDADSVRLMYGMLTSGTPRRLEGIAPFSVVFGAAASIELTLNGVPVDFTEMIRKSGTARFLVRSDRTVEIQSQDN